MRSVRTGPGIPLIRKRLKQLPKIFTVSQAINILNDISEPAVKRTISISVKLKLVSKFQPNRKKDGVYTQL